MLHEGWASGYAMPSMPEAPGVRAMRNLTDRRFVGLLEAAPDAMLCVDGDGRIALVNAQAGRLFGYGREELIGQQVEILVPDLVRGGDTSLGGGYVADPTPRALGGGHGTGRPAPGWQHVPGGDLPVGLRRRGGDSGHGGRPGCHRADGYSGRAGTDAHRGRPGPDGAPAPAVTAAGEPGPACGWGGTRLQQPAGSHLQLCGLCGRGSRAAGP